LGNLKSPNPFAAAMGTDHHLFNRGSHANIHCQPLPESISEEHEIYTGYDGRHRQHVKYDGCLSAHLSALIQS